MAFILKAVTTMHPWALPNLLYTMPLTRTYCNTLINFAIVMYYNYKKNNRLTLAFLGLKDISNIKKIEKKDIINILGKNKP